MRLLLRGCGLVIALAGAALHGADGDVLYSLIPPRTVVEPAATVEIQIAVLNASTAPITLQLPPELEGDVDSGTLRWEIDLRAANPAPVAAQTIAAGGFVLHTYTLRVPGDAPAGRAALAVNVGGAPARTALDIAGRRLPAAEQTAGPTQRPTTSLIRALPVAAALRRTFTDRVSPHEPIYFIYGLDAPAAKFQFSFKYKLLDFSNVAPQRRTRTLQFAFTQRSLWDIEGASSPFYDTSYMPELMYQALTRDPEKSEGVFTWLGFQAAYKHESNGRDGPMSRSMDIVYARSVFALGRLNGWHLLALPEVFTYVGSRDENAGIEDFRGYGKLHLVFGRNDGPSLMASLWAGDDFERTSLQLELTVPFRTRFLDFETYVLLQYFNGYGESLLSYREKSDTIRAGVSLVR